MWKGLGGKIFTAFILKVQILTWWSLMFKYFCYWSLKKNQGETN